MDARDRGLGSRAHFSQLESWKRAAELAEECYRLSAQLPESERFELSSQLRRAAVSVAANIAEGRGRGSQREFARFLLIARGSLMEIESHLTLACRLGFIGHTQILRAIQLRNEVGQLLNGLLRRLRLDGG